MNGDVFRIVGLAKVHSKEVESKVEKLLVGNHFDVFIITLDHGTCMACNTNRLEGKGDSHVLLWYVA